MNPKHDYFFDNVEKLWALGKVGGLDGRDQSRSRSRTSIVLRQTFFKCRDYPSRRDQLLKVSRSRVSIEISTKIEILGHKPCRDFIFWTVENVHHVETDTFLTSRSRVSIKTTSRQIETPKASFGSSVFENCISFQKKWKKVF